MSYLLLCIITSFEAANSIFGKVANGHNALSELCCTKLLDKVCFWSATNQHVVQHLTNSEHVLGLHIFLPQLNIQSTNEYVVQHVCVAEFTSHHVVKQCSYVALPATN